MTVVWPAVLGARRKLSPFVWALIFRTGGVQATVGLEVRGFDGGEDVVGAAGDLPGDGEPGSAAAATGGGLA